MPVHGLPAAAQHFLGRDLGAVEVQEAAWLAGAIRAPNRLLSGSRPEAKQRRDEILVAMRDNHLLPVETARRALARPLPRPAPETGRTAPYFVDFVAAEFGRRAALPVSGRRGSRLHSIRLCRERRKPPYARASRGSKRHGHNSRAGYRRPPSPLTRTRGRYGPWWAAVTTGKPVQSGDAGRAPAGIDLQALRLSGRLRGGASRHRAHPGFPARRRAPVGAGRRRQLGAAEHGWTVSWAGHGSASP